MLIPNKEFQNSHRTVRVGFARSNDMHAGGGSPFFSAVHTPFGPRKSATPALVEMPAPVLNRKFRKNDQQLCAGF